MKTKLKQSPYIRHSIISDPLDFLQHVEMHHAKKDFMHMNGVSIKLGSDRYKVFKFKGLTCSHCQKVASFMAIETFKIKSETLSYHINLYGYDEQGEEILFTKDHIVPKSKGGADLFDNYQTMCTVCNAKKGSKIS